MRCEFCRCFAVAMAIVTVLACAVVYAADGSTSVTLDLKDVDVKAAIESLFRGTGKNFAIEPDVSGTIPSVSIKDAPFEVALKTLAKTAGLKFRIDNDIYLIGKKEATADMPATQATTTTADTEVDDTTTEETKIEKVSLSNTGASELLAKMNGQQGSSGGYGGMGGGMGGGMMGGGMMRGMGGGMMGGMGSDSGGYPSVSGVTYTFWPPM